MSDARVAFRNELAHVFAREADQRRIADEVGLVVGRIQFDGSAINTWAAILKEAELSGLATKLAAAAVGEYDRLETFANAYLARHAAPVPAARAPRSPAELTNLLPKLYENWELKILVSETVPELVDSVAWDKAAKEVAFQIVEKLDARGCLDAAWFAALLKSRPGRANEIREAAAKLGVALPA